MLNTGYTSSTVLCCQAAIKLPHNGQRWGCAKDRAHRMAPSIATSLVILSYNNLETQSSLPDFQGSHSSCPTPISLLMSQSSLRLGRLPLPSEEQQARTPPPGSDLQDKCHIKLPQSVSVHIDVRGHVRLARIACISSADTKRRLREACSTPLVSSIGRGRMFLEWWCHSPITKDQSTCAHSRPSRRTERVQTKRSTHLGPGVWVFQIWLLVSSAC